MKIRFIIIAIVAVIILISLLIAFRLNSYEPISIITTCYCHTETDINYTTDVHYKEEIIYSRWGTIECDLHIEKLDMPVEFGSYPKKLIAKQIADKCIVKEITASDEEKRIHEKMYPTSFEEFMDNLAEHTMGYLGRGYYIDENDSFVNCVCTV